MTPSTGGEAPSVDDGATTTARVVWAGGTPPDAVRDALPGMTLVGVATLQGALDDWVTERFDGLIVDGVTEPEDTLARIRERPIQVPVVLVVRQSIAVAGEALDANTQLFFTGEQELQTAALATTVEEALTTGPGDARSIRGASPRKETRLKELAMDAAPVGITIANTSLPDDPLVYVNDEFEEETGYPAAEVLGCNCRLLQGPETDDDAVARLRDAVEKKEPTTVELRNYRKNGEQFWNRVQLSPLCEGEDETYFVGFQSNVTDYRQTEASLRQERERLDGVISRIQGLVTDTIELLTAADSRQQIERDVTTRFGMDAAYTFAWVGRYDTTTEEVVPVEVAGTDVSTEGTAFDLTAATPAAKILQDAIESGNPVVTHTHTDIASLLLGTEPETPNATIAVVPLTYRNATYGVLTVASAHHSTFEIHEKEILDALGHSIGSAINAVGSRRLIATDTVVEATVDLQHPGVFPFWLTSIVDAELDYETSRYDTDGNLVALFTVRGSAPEAVVAAASDDERVADARTLATTDDGGVVQFRIPDAPLVDLLSDYGAHLKDIIAADGRGSVTFEMPDETSARALIERTEDMYDAELASYHTSDREQPTVEELQSTLEDRLTDRQLSALRRAYISGFFDWPRKINGEQLAESMDIAPSTFHQHLRTAQKKVYAVLFGS